MIKKKKSLVLDEEKIREVKNIGRGVFAPVTGFLRRADFESVVARMRLKNGKIWPIPIVLDISEDDYQRIKKEKEILLNDLNGRCVALLKDIEVFTYDKELFARNVFGTLDKNHPGVEEVYRMGKYLVGGDVYLLDNSKRFFPEYNLTPKETRKMFRERGWKTVVGFQTRNVPHRGHEFLHKYALKNEKVDGLFIQPVVGRKKLEDFKDEFILASYEVLLDRYYPQDRVILGVLPLKMRYAGPREAVFHALIRKNFGCTHFIVGRDHAGVGGYYPPFAAQKIFDDLSQEELGIKILKYPEVIYCTACQKHTFKDACQHSKGTKIFFSGTKLREKIKQGKQPSFYLIRPEVYYLLFSSYDTLVDFGYQNNDFKQQKGFCLWLTGLSRAGKTTIGDKVYEILKKRGLKVERLDGDLVRQNLSKDLGFTRKDREENIKRVGSLVKLFVQRQIITIASFISPYKKQRQELREKIPNFIEVFVNCSLEVCEARDERGLYQKAREGKIKNFTGISDIYEEPEDPEIKLFTDKETVEESVQKIIRFLEKNGFIETA